MKVYIVMGVSGVGKTTIGKLLAARLKIPFFDADDYHPEESKVKMSSGIPLVDQDREGWLEFLSLKIKEWHQDQGAVLACSALKEKFRHRLSSIPEEDLVWIYLHSSYDLIYERIRERKGHYFDAELLRSQYEILEPPVSGIHVDVAPSQEEVVDEIIRKIMEKKTKSSVGLIGLGVMGKSLALNFASKGIKISVYNRHSEGKEEDIALKFAEQHKGEFHFPAFDDLQPFVNSLEEPRTIFLMVSAGKAVDLVIDELEPLLKKGDLIIDGGNSHYKDTNRREEYLGKEEILFLGVGVSGGEEGALKGPSIMPGGDIAAYNRFGSLLEQIAAKDNHGKPCCTYLGPQGSGHFVKMVHNGIEYGEMQLIAEFYHLLRYGYGLSPEEIASWFSQWNEEFKSYLLEITVEILRKKEAGSVLIDKILDAAKQKGTGGWSTNAALELGTPLDTITAAVLARNISGRKDERVEADHLYGLSRKTISDPDLTALKQAYSAASIINHAIGFDLLSAASSEYQWNLDLAEIARIWTNGCIIISGLMERLKDIFRDHKQHLLFSDQIRHELNQSINALSSVMRKALAAKFPMPASSAAINYFFSFTSALGSANLIQAQRDYFGAHTYERTDKERGIFFHTLWKEDQSRD